MWHQRAERTLAAGLAREDRPAAPCIPKRTAEHVRRRVIEEREDTPRRRTAHGRTVPGSYFDACLEMKWEHFVKTSCWANQLTFRSPGDSQRRGAGNLDRLSGRLEPGIHPPCKESQIASAADARG